MPGTLTGPITGFMERQKGRGVVEYSALQRMGKSGMLIAGGGNANVQLSTAGIGNGADTTEDLLFTATIPANALYLVGHCICLQAFGNVTATSATKTAKVYFGTSIVNSAQYLTTTTGNWSIYVEIYKSGPSTQIGFAQIDAAGSATIRTVNVTTNGSETDTAGIVVKVTGQSTVATANQVVCNGFIVTGYD